MSVPPVPPVTAAPIVVALLLFAGCTTTPAPPAPAQAPRADTTTTAPATAAAPSPTWPVTLQCGARLFQIESKDDGLRLRGEGEPLALQPVPSASGVRLVAVAQPTTSAWLRGDHARLVLQGQALPECRILNREAP